MSNFQLALLGWGMIVLGFFLTYIPLPLRLISLPISGSGILLAIVGIILYEKEQ